MARTAEAFAPAKINLTLHVTGQRADGYHLLDSLVVFAAVGDRIAVKSDTETTLRVTGPLAAGVPTDRSNLVLKAAKLLGASARIQLEKHLPAAAGIGGGSSDAAATLRALCTLYGMPMPSVAELLTLGADVPVCATAEWQRMAGIGEEVTSVQGGVRWPVILVNPRIDVPTPKIFKALSCKNNPPMPRNFPDWADRVAALDWLRNQRNDLEMPAMGAAPVIGDILKIFRASTGCDLARMSGSGATCFGLFYDDDSRDAAAEALRHAHPEWWVSATHILP